MRPVLKIFLLGVSCPKKSHKVGRENFILFKILFVILVDNLVHTHISNNFRFVIFFVCVNHNIHNWESQGMKGIHPFTFRSHIS